MTVLPSDIAPHPSVWHHWVIRHKRFCNQKTPLCRFLGRIKLLGQCKSWDNKAWVYFRLSVCMATWRKATHCPVGPASPSAACIREAPGGGPFSRACTCACAPSLPGWSPWLHSLTPAFLSASISSRFSCTMASWMPSCHRPWPSATWWPQIGKDPGNTGKQRERCGRSWSLIRKWLVMCGKWVTSTRYENAVGPAGSAAGTVGLMTEPESQEGVAGLKQSHVSPSVSAAVLLSIRGERSESVLKDQGQRGGRSGSAIRKIILSPKAGIIMERMSLFENKGKLEWIIEGRVDAVSAGKPGITFGYCTWSPGQRLAVTALVWPPL